MSISGQRIAILEIMWGPRAGQRAVLPSGRSIRVGRTELADFMVPDDGEMSGAHFNISWDGASCSVRDLNSAKGTYIDGQRVEAGDVGHQGWIRAGRTDFAVYFEASQAAQIHPGHVEAPCKYCQVRDTLAAHASEASLFAVIDAARDPRTLEVLRTSVCEYQSLYDGVSVSTRAEAAPYLVQLSLEEPALRRLVHEGWGQSWGIYLLTRLSLRNLRRHLRRFLFIEEDESRATLYFRFYDPRVLRCVFPVMTVRQRSEFSEGISSFLVEDANGELLRLTP